MTMTKPEMDVVRFSESDVIVASSIADSFKVTGSNNGVSGDMLIDGMSVKAFEEALKKIHPNSNSYFRYQNNDPVHVQNLLNHDVNGSINDGTYVDQGEQQITTDIFGRLWQCQ